MFSARPMPLSEKAASTHLPVSSKEICKIVAPALTELLAILSIITPIDDESNLQSKARVSFANSYFKPSIVNPASIYWRMKS